MTYPMKKSHHILHRSSESEDDAQLGQADQADIYVIGKSFCGWRIVL
jgi:hypothetical protein